MTESNERKLVQPRPNSLVDPVRLGTSVERPVADKLREYAAADDRPLLVFLRVVLTKYVEDREAEALPAEELEPAEARYS